MFNKGEGGMMSLRDWKEQEAGVGEERHQVMVLIWPLQRKRGGGQDGAKLLEANSPPAQTGTTGWLTMSCQNGQVQNPPPPHAQTLAGDFQESHKKSWSKAEVMMSHCGFDLHFPDDQWCWEHLFVIPVGRLYVCFGGKDGYYQKTQKTTKTLVARMWRKENSCTLLIGTESEFSYCTESVRILKQLQTSYFWVYIQGDWNQDLEEIYSHV